MPDSYSGEPHPSTEILAWVEQWRALAGIPIAARWVSAEPVVAGAVGLGSAVVEVVVREKSPTEKLVFCLNQGGAGSGTVEVTTGPGAWQATEALTGETLAGSVTGGTWKAPMKLGALGYKVLRLAK